MRIHRIIAGVVSGALLGLVPVALAAPAHAADVSTVTTLSASSTLIQHKGYSPYISASVTKADGSGVYYGEVDLQAKPAGGGWKTVATKTASGFVSFADVVPKKNTDYRAIFKGGASSSDNYLTSESRNLKIKVQRKLTIDNPRGTKLKGKVAPKYAKKKIVIKKKVGKKWKKFRTLKTNKKSRFTITLPAKRKRTHFRIIVPGNKSYAKVFRDGSTIRS